MLNSTEIAVLLDGTLYGSDTATFSTCTADSRQVKAGAMFIALAGEKTDGHKYIGKALQAGASIVLAEGERLEKEGLPSIPEGGSIIAVQNSLRGLQQLAAFWLRDTGAKVIGVTGSNGKTTTKDMAAAVLKTRFRVHKNAGNLNTEIGLPMTILEAPKDTEIMVLEMGMRGLGQIKALCEICHPQDAIITNIGTTHMELLGSQDNISRAKWEIIESLSVGGTAVLNADDRLSMEKAVNYNGKKLIYGIEGKFGIPDLRADNIMPNGEMGTNFWACYKQEKAFVKLPLPGKHNVADALAALGAGLLHGVELAEGAQALEKLQISSMRLEILPGYNKSTIINDTYNANPSSMKESLAVMRERGGEKTIAVLGEMYELGFASESGHKEVGAEAARMKVSELITVGKLAEQIAAGALETGFPASRIHICRDCQEAINAAKHIIDRLGADTWVLVKGSRGMHMEDISNEISQNL